MATMFLTLALLGQAVTAPPVETGEWKLGGSTAKFAMEARGRATEPSGAVLSLRSTSSPGGATGTILATLPAKALRGRRVTLTGELLAETGNGGGLLIRADAGPAVAIALENSLAAPVRPEDGWSARSVSIPVPDNATNLAFGILLSEGSVSARGVRLETGEPFAGLPISEPARKVLDEAISLVKENALRRNLVDWKVVEPQVRALAGGARKSSEAYAAIQWLLSELGDRHSYFMPPTGAKEFRSSGAQNPLPVVRTLPDGVGYISVAGYRGGDREAMRAYARGVHVSLDSATPAARCGFVVDLRGNTGGNMWPMLAGLKPLLGDPRLGTFEDPSGASPPWIAGDIVGVSPPETLKRLEAAPVAILTGPRTASSGEAVTIAFSGRPLTRSFGQPTAGLSTANSNLPLSDGAIIFLTTATMADRTGKRYGDRIDPDELVAAPVHPKDDGDPTLAAAVRWLKQSPSCSGTSR